MEAAFAAILVGMIAEMRVAVSRIGKRVDRIELDHERDRTRAYLLHGSIAIIPAAVAFFALHH